MSDHASRVHARFGASSAHRWFACPGSLRLCAQIPEKPSAYALEGTRAHEMLEALLREQPLPENLNTELEMYAYVRVAYDYISDLRADWPASELLVEHRFDIPCATAPGEVFGTNDACIYVPEMRALWVVDYKHGAGVAVDVVGNKQLRFYGLGALSANPKWEVDSVCLAIVQPRAHHPAGPIREEWVSPADLATFGLEIDKAVVRAKQPNAPLIPGGAQCRFCPAAAICPAREKQALTVTGGVFGSISEVRAPLLPAPADLPPERLAEVLEGAKLLKDWVGEVEGHALGKAKDGASIPGWKLVEAQARRRWEGGEDVVAASLSKITDGRVAPEVFRPPALVGVTEAERLIKDDARAQAPKGRAKKAVEDAVEQMAFLTTKKSSGAVTLVRDSDPRPSWRPGADHFGGVQLVKMITEGETAK